MVNLKWSFINHHRSWICDRKSFIALLSSTFGGCLLDECIVISTSEFKNFFLGFFLETCWDWYIVADAPVKFGCLLIVDCDVAVLYWTAWIVASYLLKLTNVVFRELFAADEFSTFLGVVFWEIGVPAPVFCVFVASGVNLRDGLTLVYRPWCHG